MLGVTMEESGITKIIQVRLDEDTLNANLTFDSQEDFVEEDVPPEEGVVIPPRPPRREHNPDGTLKIVEKPADKVEEPGATYEKEAPSEETPIRETLSEKNLTEDNTEEKKEEPPEPEQTPDSETSGS